MHILMVAAENAALPGAKVGGIADVVRDIPRALARAGHQVSVLIPGYQALSQLPHATRKLSLTVEFAGSLETLELYALSTPGEPVGITHLIIEHPLFAACGVGQVYCHDSEEPFATDAVKFALFSQAAAYAVVSGAVPDVDVIHAHDWHASVLLLLRAWHPGFKSLQQLSVVFTIHNLSLQGIRPLRDDWSSPHTWFPDLKLDTALVADPRWPDCINLMRAGINLADQVHVVSPTYAREILEPSEPARGLVRGEGLENDLQRISALGRLHGILNGCEYPPGRLRKSPVKNDIVKAAEAALTLWVGDKVTIKSSWYHAWRILQQWSARKQKDSFLVTSVGRLTPQKVSLLQVEFQGSSVLDQFLLQLDKGMLILQGSGDPDCELFMTQVMRRHDNFLFLCGYDEALGDMLYRFGDLFLMPSLFEPCGISQMLAMRAGTPCLVHQVGGLADTVTHLVNGFTFSGEDPQEQAAALLAEFQDILQMYSNRIPQWQAITKAAAASRFSWDAVVNDYETLLYGLKPGDH